MGLTHSSLSPHWHFSVIGGVGSLPILPARGSLVMAWRHLYLSRIILPLRAAGNGLAPGRPFYVTLYLVNGVLIQAVIGDHEL
jgi:hypothetical protein